MAINFPNTPTNGELYTDLTSGNIYVYNSTYGVWRLYSPVAGTANTGGSYAGNRGAVNISGLGDIFRVHNNTLSENVTITTANNSLAAGPITISSGKTLTIQTGARVSIV